MWERASYRLELSSETARLFGTVNGQAMGAEPLSLPLPWAGGLIHRLLQNEGPPIWYTGTMGAHRPIVETEPTDKPSWQLLLLQPGDYAFDLDMTLPVESDAVRQTVRFHWPATTRTQLQAEVPGNVELVSGAAVLQRSYNAESDTTGFELAVGGAEVELIFTLNNRQKSQERLWDARTWTNAVVTPTLDRFEVVLEPQVLQGQLDSARWEFPENVEISDVAGEGGVAGRSPQGPRCRGHPRPGIRRRGACRANTVNQHRIGGLAFPRQALAAARPQPFDVAAQAGLGRVWTRPWSSPPRAMA